MRESAQNCYSVKLNIIYLLNVTPKTWNLLFQRNIQLCRCQIFFLFSQKLCLLDDNDTGCLWWTKLRFLGMFLSLWKPCQFETGYIQKGRKTLILWSWNLLLSFTTSSIGLKELFCQSFVLFLQSNFRVTIIAWLVQGTEILLNIFYDFFEKLVWCLWLLTALSSVHMRKKT